MRKLTEGIQFHNEDKQNYPFCRSKLLVDKLEQYKLEPTNQDLIKAIKVFKPTNEKKCFSVPE